MMPADRDCPFNRRHAFYIVNCAGCGECPASWRPAILAGTRRQGEGTGYETARSDIPWRSAAWPAGVPCTDGRDHRSAVSPHGCAFRRRAAGQRDGGLDRNGDAAPLDPRGGAGQGADGRRRGGLGADRRARGRGDGRDRAHRRRDGCASHRHQYGVPGQEGHGGAVGFGADARSGPRPAADRGSTGRGQRAGDAEDAAGLGRCLPERAGTGAAGGGGRGADADGAWPDPGAIL